MPQKAWSDSSEETLRKQLSKSKGETRIDLLGRLYTLSQDSDAAYRSRCYNELVAETRRQRNAHEEAVAVSERAIFFYNNDMNDSVFALLPKDLERLRTLKEWDTYYNVWTFLANSYIYSGRSTLGLRQVQEMFNDAKERGNNYGMGLAYYAMGNAYYIMNSMEESANAYQKSMGQLDSIRPMPSLLPEVYASYGEVLEAQKDYRKLDDFTTVWNAMALRFIEERHLENTLSGNIIQAYYYLACTKASLGLNSLPKARLMLDHADRMISEDALYLHLTALYLRAQLLLQQGNYQEALEKNTERMRLMEATDDKSVLLTVRKQRAEILSKLGRHAEAAELYREMYVINDSVNAHETKKQLAEMNTIFKVDELEREQERMKMQQEREQFRNIIIIAVIIVLALVIFSIFRYIAAKRLKVAHSQLQVAYDQLEETTTAKERIESELRIARDIQMGMVPQTFPPFPERTDIDLYASMTPAKEVGGDLYDYLLLTEDDGSAKLYFALGDVSGKGVPASLFMSQATRLFRALAKQKMMPASIATRLNDELSENNDNSMFVTMFIGLIDLATGHLDFCNAGHNQPVVMGPQPEFLKMIPNAPIGLWPGMEYEGEELADISGKPFFVYTDGLNEAENTLQEQFSDERLLQVLASHPFVSAQQTVELLIEEVEKHRNGADPNDDLTMLCVKISPDKTI